MLVIIIISCILRLQVPAKNRYYWHCSYQNLCEIPNNTNTENSQISYFRDGNNCKQIFVIPKVFHRYQKTNPWISQNRKCIDIPKTDTGNIKDLLQVRQAITKLAHHYSKHNCMCKCDYRLLLCFRNLLPSVQVPYVWTRPPDY